MVRANAMQFKFGGDDLEPKVLVKPDGFFTGVAPDIIGFLSAHVNNGEIDQL